MDMSCSLLPDKLRHVHEPSCDIKVSKQDVFLKELQILLVESVMKSQGSEIKQLSVPTVVQDRDKTKSLRGWDWVKTKTR